MLHAMGFSLKANKKSIEGASHADRDAQFQHINRTGKAFEAKGQPVISIDCKKKELIGNFKNGGRERQAKWQNKNIDVHCLPFISHGTIIPTRCHRPMDKIDSCITPTTQRLP